ncbi:MAG: T9SS type A sorting domain-containing protein [Gelidibacter sp.]
MKKKLLIGPAIVALITMHISCNTSTEKSDIEKLREKHQAFLDNSPFKKTQHYTEEEREEKGLPPNAYYEQLWDLTMDPNTGRPMPERVLELQEQLRQDRLSARGVSGTMSAPWVDRGPNNQGGRTRGIMFDPNDVGNANPAQDYTRVFAGGVSGGLWVNDDITNISSPWTQLNIQANISVTTIISDPNNPSTFFIGSGESFTSGQAVGRGIWRSTDAGITWQNVLGGTTNTVGQFVNGIFYVNDIVARNNGGVTELYAAISSAFYGDAANPNNFNGLNEMGLYKSVDNGNSWTRFDIQHSNGDYKNPCDIELDINNNIWFTTTDDAFGNMGGDIYKSTDGINFNLITTVTGARRTELEPSQTSPNIFWVAARVGNQANLYLTTNAFSSLSPLTSEPNDADTGIPANDYTRGQAFYDLPIEADQNNVLYVGGIDLFRTDNFGISWNQISKWSNNNNLSALQVPLVHADQHAIVFRPGSNGNQAVFGNDGGVYFSGNISSIVTSNSTTAIRSRNVNYNTTQFYKADINQVDIANGDDLVGGLQDNGTQISVNSNAGANGFVDPRSGDGAYTEISKNGDYLITSYPGEVHIFSNFPSYNNNAYTITNTNRGSFINEAELDDNRNVLYTNSSGSTNQISRYTNVNVQALLTSSDLTNALLNARPTAFKINPYPTAGVPPTNTATLLIGLANGRLLKLTNADNSPVWSSIGSASFVGSISDIEFGQNENEILVTMYNYGVASIWRTTNGGTTWQNKEGNLPDMPVRCILQNPLLPNEVILGTDLGIWATPDITTTNPIWVPLYNGMSDVTVVDLDLRTSDNVILAATHGRGLFTGQFTSIPLSVNENSVNTNLISLYPTVSNGEITVSSMSSLGKLNLDIFNMNGQKVFTNSVELNSDKQYLKLNLATGHYLAKFYKGTFTETKKIVIK